MRYLELLILLLTAVMPFVLGINWIRQYKKTLTLILIGLLTAHIFIEGPRWQMAPIYLIYLICMILLAKSFKFFKGGWFRKSISGLGFFTMIGLGFVLSKALPVFKLPEPKGEYKVGAHYSYLETSEDEIITLEKGDKRTLTLKIWYPAEVTDQETEPYLNEAGRKGFAAKYGLPQSTFGYLDYVKTNTFRGAEPADGVFPVIIFSHGYYSNAFGYHSLLEEIVSQGFIVVNVNHTYESVASKFPNGDIKYYDNEFGLGQNNQEMSDLIWKATEDLNKAKDIEEKKKAIEYVLRNYSAAEITDRWVQDISMIIDQIPSWADTGLFADHIDLSKIGVMGHSQGGAAAGQSLLFDSRISAGINIDGVQWGRVVDTSIHKPLLLISSDWPTDHPDFNEVAYYNNISSHFHALELEGSGHSNFMDIPFMVDIPMLNEAGTINPRKAVKIASHAVVDFFKIYLLGQESELNSLTEIYPELRTSGKYGGSSGY